jgi:hypothetical protein
MAGNGPSADEVARAVRREEFLRQLEVCSPHEYEDYRRATSKETAISIFGIVGVLAVSVIVALLGGKDGVVPAFFVFIFGAIGFGFIGQYPQSDELLRAFDKRMHENAVHRESEILRMAKKLMNPLQSELLI